jgi:hypothetical protein
MEVRVAASLVPALQNGLLFQNHVTKRAADITLCCEKIHSVLERSSIKLNTGRHRQFSCTAVQKQIPFMEVR